MRAAIERVRDGVVWRSHDDLPYFHGEVEECVNGGVLAIAAYFGVLGEGSDRILSRLLGEERLDDGGWNCDRAEGSTRSSFDSTICVLEGLLEFERAVPDAPSAVAEARRSGEEYLLERRLFRKRSTGEVVKERYLDVSFPPYWFYDVLRALDHFREAGGAPDPRLAEAIEVVRSQQGDDGRWAAGTPHRGEVFFAVDAPKGEPSRWNTLRALRVLRWWDEGGSPATRGRRVGRADQSAAGTDSPSSRAMRARAFCSLGDIRPSMRTATPRKSRVSVTAGHQGRRSPSSSR